jgi:hypothetical protein
VLEGVHQTLGPVISAAVGEEDLDRVGKPRLVLERHLPDIDRSRALRAGRALGPVVG